MLNIEDHTPIAIPKLLFATINGMIGVLASISDETYAFLRKLEENLRRVIPFVGELSHEEYVFSV